MVCVCACADPVSVVHSPQDLGLLSPRTVTAQRGAQKQQGMTEEEQWRHACTHMLQALMELSLWQAGSVEPDGEIRRKDGLVGAGDLGASMGAGQHPVAPARTQASLRGRILMEKDEDQSDRWVGGWLASRAAWWVVGGEYRPDVVFVCVCLSVCSLCRDMTRRRRVSQRIAHPSSSN